MKLVATATGIFNEPGKQRASMPWCKTTQGVLAVWPQEVQNETRRRQRLRDCAVSLRFSMTYSMRARSSMRTRPWTLLRLPIYAYSCSTNTTASIPTRLRKCDATPSSRRDAVPKD
jgi:hypothetical protein